MSDFFAILLSQTISLCTLTPALVFLFLVSQLKIRIFWAFFVYCLLGPLCHFFKNFMLAAFRYKENFSKYSLYIYRIRIATLFICCLAAGVFLVLNHSLQTQPNQNVIYIDCSKRLPPAKSMIGFLHSLSLQSPPSKYITSG
jgi:hypothetical protein